MHPVVSPSPPPLRVTCGRSHADKRIVTFSANFRIGRGDECELCIKDEFVSRVHVSVTYESGQWLVRDLGSANGVFVGDRRVPGAVIGEGLTIRLGIGGPFVAFEVERPKPPEPPPAPVPSLSQQQASLSQQQPSLSQQRPAGMSETKTMATYMEHYFGSGSDKPAGEHTIMVRRAFQHVQKKQRWRYRWIAGGLLLALLGVGAYAWYEHQQNAKQLGLARDLFYAMKSVDVDIANVEKLVMDTHTEQGQEQIRKYQSRRREMEHNYDQFLTSLHTYDPKMTEQDRLILRVTRIFGECELAMPDDFKKEIENYIGKWKSSKRYSNAIHTAQEKGYTSTIAQEFLSQDLPPQFFYLAMQESDFDAYISGPQTYMGIAKGMWQFIPQTAMKYGLKIGPLSDLRRPDPGDDRHHWEKATVAAAHYIKDLYSTDAQASGLLVIASYNWGEDKVIKLIQSLPPNPKDRNFWKLMAAYHDKIPQETYDYVFYIVSAAVIGENPRLFGFDFDSPLASVSEPRQ